LQLLVVPISLDAILVSVFPRSGCVMDKWTV